MITKRAGPSEAAFLTPRERQLIRLVAEGCRNAEIAMRLRVREQTVKNQLSIVYEKLGVRGRVALALYAHRHNIG